MVESVVNPTIVPLMKLVVDSIVNNVGEPVLDIVAWSQPQPNHDYVCVMH